MSKIDSGSLHIASSPAPAESLALLRNFDKASRRAAPGSLIEAGGLWLLTLCAGVVLLAAILHGHEEGEIRELRRARLEVTLAELSERLERNLALGFELTDDNHVQMLIEDLLDRDRDVQFIEIFDINGVSLFNTDRGAIGEVVPEAWLIAAAQAGGRPWEVSRRDATVMGIIVQGPLRDAAGFVAVTLAAATRPDAWSFGLRVLIALAVVLIAAPLAIAWALRGNVSPDDERLVQAAIDHILQTEVRLQFASTALRDADGSLG